MSIDTLLVQLDHAHQDLRVASRARGWAELAVMRGTAEAAEEFADADAAMARAAARVVELRSEIGRVAPDRLPAITK